MKKILLLAALVLSAFQPHAAPVDLAHAQATAQHFLQANAAKRLNGASASNLKLLHAEMNSFNVTQAAYYIFNTTGAFIIVAGDDRAPEILAYGDGALDMNTMPENMKFWLGYYKSQMEYLHAHPGLQVNKPTIKAGVSVEPMIEAMWDQGSPYYSQCPLDGDIRAMTGCATTSLAQVFYKWKYPTGPTPVVPGYTTRNGKFTLDALPSTTFDWANMLPTYRLGSYNETNKNAVAKLMRYIGQAEEMNYDKAGSDAWEDDIARACELFGYEDATVVYKATMNFDTGVETTYINDEDWYDLLVNEMLAGRPLVFCAFDYSNVYHNYGGHAFNVDGYDASDGTFHINWGWSGTGNGNFTMNNFANQGSNYHLGQRVVMNIQPSTSTTPTIKIGVEQLNLQTRVGQPVTSTFTVKGRRLTGNITLTLNDATGSFALDETSVSVAEAQAGKSITVTYNPNSVGSHTATVTLSSPGAEPKTIALNGTAGPAVFDPVMEPAYGPMVTLTSFRADWTDQTAPENVNSYTLEVKTKPEFYLLEEVDWSNVSMQFSPVTSSAANYFPAGWTFAGNDLWAEDGYISINGNGSFSTPTYDINGTNKITVVFTAKASYPSSKFTISTSVDSEVFTLTDRSFAQYVAVLDCAAADMVTITNNSDNPGFLNMAIYAGVMDADQQTDDPDYRLIEGITEKQYNVTQLTAGGTFLYRVKAFYTDGTESEWSNEETVTLVEGGYPGDHEFTIGDVNHDGIVGIADATSIIDYILNNNVEICAICADVTNDGIIGIADVTALIDMILNKNN